MKGLKPYVLIEDGLYAGEGCVKTPDVDAVICLDPTCRVDAGEAVEYCYNIEDYTVEPLSEFAGALEKLLELRKDGLRVYVHCYAGCGRTGTLISAYLILFRGLNAREAIEYYRGLRGCGPQSWEQEEFLYALASIKRILSVKEILELLLNSRDFEDFMARAKSLDY